MILPDGFVGEDLGAGVDMALDKVSAEPVADAEGALEIDGIAGLELTEVGDAKGFVEQVKTVRQAPLVATLSPRASSAVKGASIQSSAPVATGFRARTLPQVSTMPVNMRKAYAGRVGEKGKCPGFWSC
jgi:hypothetical protein